MNYCLNIDVQCREKVFAPFLFFNFFLHICHTEKIQIKQMLILHKDNASKYKMQFLNDDLIY